MYRIAICDADRNFTLKFRKEIEKLLLQEKTAAELEIFHDTASFLCRTNNGIVFDLIFLDIQLDGENGCSFARRLRRDNVQTDIISITVTEDYAVAGYDVAPLFYLLKPVDREQLTYAFRIFLERRSPCRILLHTSGKILALNINDILYCEVNGHSLQIRLVSGQTRQLRYSLNQLEQQLPASLFARPHQSYLVNLKYIDSIARYELTLNTGLTLPISQSKYLSLRNIFVLYCSRRIPHR